MQTIYNEYFYNSTDFDNKDGAYKPLKVNSKTGQNKLNIPKALKPYKETPTDMYFKIVSQTGETKFLGNSNTYTWGYNQSFGGPAIVLKRGKTIHVSLTNRCPELTSYHWHGLSNISGEADGGCHTPVMPGETKNISFTIDQPAATCWLHAHPCPATGEQVYHGLALPVIISDSQEASLPLPRTYGVNDIPVILQDRDFDSSDQFNYNKHYDPDGVLGSTCLVDGTVNPYFDVITQKVRLRILDGSNRREYRLHFSNNLQFTQVAGDGSLLPHPVKMTKVMITAAERMEVIADFGACVPGSTVYLYSDDTPILAFKIHKFKRDNTILPDTLFNMPDLPVTPDKPCHHIVLNSMDEGVMINSRKFSETRVDSIQQVGNVEYWKVFNDNKAGGGGMIHPYHMHGTQFQVVSRNGHAPNPNELGFKDTIAVSPQETVLLKVMFKQPGVFMYHCHIIEHEDGGMMAQVKAIDPKDPNHDYHLKPMGDLNKLFSKSTVDLINNQMNTGMENMSGMNM